MSEFKKMSLAVFILLLALGSNQSMGAEIEDPTRPLVHGIAGGTPGGITITRTVLVIESILVSDRRKIVVINGKSLTEGDFVDGMEITVIDRDSIGIKHNGKVFYLQPAPDVIVKGQS